jgi:hypothetical protein
MGDLAQIRQAKHNESKVFFLPSTHSFAFLFLKAAKRIAKE